MPATRLRYSLLASSSHLSLLASGLLPGLLTSSMLAFCLHFSLQSSPLCSGLCILSVLSRPCPDPASPLTCLSCILSTPSQFGEPPWCPVVVFWTDLPWYSQWVLLSLQRKAWAPVLPTLIACSLSPSHHESQPWKLSQPLPQSLGWFPVSSLANFSSRILVGRLRGLGLEPTRSWSLVGNPADYGPWLPICSKICLAFDSDFQ